MTTTTMMLLSCSSSSAISKLTAAIISNAALSKRRQQQQQQPMKFDMAPANAIHRNSASGTYRRIQLRMRTLMHTCVFYDVASMRSIKACRHRIGPTARTNTRARRFFRDRCPHLGRRQSHRCQDPIVKNARTQRRRRHPRNPAPLLPRSCPTQLSWTMCDGLDDRPEMKGNYRRPRQGARPAAFGSPHAMNAGQLAADPRRTSQPEID